MPDDEGLQARVDKLEEGQQTILGRLDELLTRKAGADETPQPGPDNRPADVATQVRMELERRDAEAAKAAEAETQKSEWQQVKDNVARLTEAKPFAPQPRRQRLMWGKP